MARSTGETLPELRRCNASVGNGVPVKLSPDIRKWLRMAQRLEREAYLRPDRRLVRLVHRFVSGVVLVHELLLAFKNTAAGKIEGKKGLAKKHLQLTPNAVYLLLRWLGLKADDFRQPSADLAVLVTRSRRLARLLDQLEKQYSPSVPRPRTPLAKSRARALH